MKVDNEQLSALIDNDIVDESLLDELITSETQQAKFARYHLIGDVMRGDVAEQLVDIDVSQKIMAEINRQSSSEKVTKLDASIKKVRLQENSKIISFVKHFGQYAIAASVAGIVVMTTLMNSSPVVENNDAGLEVLNTVPFGGAVAPVSLQTTPNASKEALKEHNKRLEALLKDHQIQLQMQP
ncbi:MAG: RseA family anti-sigma factor [Psychromonas sp.]|nr:RseA family anti-sigma factor [Psychromonas sp.]